MSEIDDGRGSELEPVIAVRHNHEGISILGNLSSCHSGLVITSFRSYYLLYEHATGAKFMRENGYSLSCLLLLDRILPG